MINVVIPLAGKDKRFEDLDVFKGFVEVEGKPLIKFCTNKLPYPFKKENVKIYFIILKEHDEKFEVSEKLKDLFPESNVITIDETTEGSPCTVLKAKQYIDNEDELIVYLADSYFEGDIETPIYENSEIAGFIPSFKDNNIKYSYSLTDDEGNVLKTVEKEEEIISNDASAGFYYFRKGKYFVEGAEKMISDDSNRAGFGEQKWFFMCPVYNQLISNNLKCKIIPVEIKKHLGDNNFIKDYIIKKVDEHEKKVNLVIPMAGGGTRFKNRGYSTPKPLIKVNGKPMVQRAIEYYGIKGTHIFIVKKEDYENHNLEKLLNEISPGCKIVQIEKQTEGAACTVLKAKEHIDNDNPIMIADSDQCVEWNKEGFFASMIFNKCDGGIFTFNSTNPNYGYMRVGKGKFMTEYVEKNPVSNICSAGVHYFKKGSDFVKAAEQMIAKNIRVNNEFYVGPVHNEMIKFNKKIRPFKIIKTWDLGNPEALQIFLDNHEI